MTARKTPLCHKMLGTLPLNSDIAPFSVDSIICCGSACSLWVPEVGNDEAAYGMTSQPLARIDRDGDRVHYVIKDGHGWQFTGRGWCADNLRCEPWEDPAKGGAK